jgi:hypothetical protein
VPHAECLQDTTLRLAAHGGEDLRSYAQRDQHGGHAFAAGRGVDEHALPGSQLGQPAQAVVRRQVTDRQGRSLGKRERLGDRYHEPDRRHDVAGEGSGRNADDPVADGEIGDARS